MLSHPASRPFLSCLTAQWTSDKDGGSIHTATSLPAMVASFFKSRECVPEGKLSACSKCSFKQLRFSSLVWQGVSLAFLIGMLILFLFEFLPIRMRCIDPKAGRKRFWWIPSSALSARCPYQESRYFLPFVRQIPQRCLLSGMFPWSCACLLISIPTYYFHMNMVYLNQDIIFMWIKKCLYKCS